ncbi:MULTISPECIES: cytochrome P450 [unclassified Streptomyces]|uniref:cytochrome P450 n=1 Tax=unclassified Streptomyces TaxID=2593676 RepID=UPI002FF43191
MSAPPASLAAPLPRPRLPLPWLSVLTAGPDRLESHFARRGEVLPDYLPGAGRGVWVRDPQLIDQVLATAGVDSAEIARVMEPVVGARSVFALHGEAHREVRRPLASAVRGSALAGCRAAIAESAQHMADAAPTRRPFRLLPLLEQTVLTADITVAASIRDPSRMQAWTQAFRRMRDMPARTSVILHGFGALPWHPPVRRARRACVALVRAEIERRRSSGEDHEDVLGWLCASSSRHLTDESIPDQIIAFMTGGQSSALGAAWAVERIVRHRRVWQRVAAEANAAVGTTYTEAAIREALRVRSPLPRQPFLLRESCELGGYHLPAGTWVVVSLWDLHRNRRLYAEPEAFRPERFLNGPGPRNTWVPFGVGPHACVASQLALLQMTEMIQALARLGDVQPDRPDDEGVGRGSLLETYPARGCRVVLHRAGEGEG